MWHQPHRASRCRKAKTVSRSTMYCGRDSVLAGGVAREGECVAALSGWVRIACLSLVFFVSTGAVLPVAADDAAPVTLDAEEQSMWDTLLVARALQGVRGVPQVDARATQLARDRSADMATRGYFSHTTPDGKTYLDLLPAYGITFRAVGETIATNGGYADPGVQAALDFILSPPHHGILFDPQYTLAGVGHAVAPDGTHYFTIIMLLN